MTACSAPPTYRSTGSQYSALSRSKAAASPRDEAAAFDRDKAEYWLPVDLYVGGAEHAVMHLLYARFFCKVARDAGYVSFGEPYARLRNQGMIQAEDGQKMSKSKGNVVTLDHAVGRDHVALA